MLQNLAKCGCTRRAAASLNFVSSGLTPNVQKRFYVTGKNQHLLNLLKECTSLDLYPLAALTALFTHSLHFLSGEVQEEASPTRNRYKIRSFRMAAAVIEKLDFRVERGDDLKGARLFTLLPLFEVSKLVFCSVGEAYRSRDQGSG